MSNSRSVPHDCNCYNDNSKYIPTATPHTIEKPASDRPLEAYAVGRIYQLEAQVEDQKNHIIQLKDTLDRVTGDYRKLLKTLKPDIELSIDGAMRKLNILDISCVYLKYERDKYYELVAYFGLQEKNYQACLQEYENEVLNGMETDLSDEERDVVKVAYEAKSKTTNEGDKHDAD